MNELDVVARDWEIASIGGAAAARHVGGGIYFFVLRSKSAGVLEPFCFCGSGIGYGGNQSGFAPENLQGLSYSDAGVLNPFCASMLHLSAGTLVGACIGLWKLPVNEGWARIDAVRDGVKYFACSGTGTAVGSGSGVLALLGTWYSYRLNNNSINPLTAIRDSIEQTVRDVGGEWERGFRGLCSSPPSF